MILNQEIEFGERIPGVSYRDRLGVYAVIESEGKIAVVNTKDDRVFLPGGGLEGEESLLDCLTRECAEELGCDIEVCEYLGYASQYLLSYKNREPLRIIGHFYSVKIVGWNELQIEDDHELSWLSPNAAVDKMYVEFQAWAIRRCLEKHKAEQDS